MFATLTESDFCTSRTRKEYHARQRARLHTLAEAVWQEVHSPCRNDDAIAYLLHEMRIITASRAAMSD